MTRIDAPSRLHFGLLHVPREGRIEQVCGLPIRQFGGIGLMIDSPKISVTVEPSNTWSASGPSSRRAMNFAQKLMSTLEPGFHRPFQITIGNCPEEHIGLGVGTALGLAVAKALAIELGNAEWSALELAPRIGRGLRSAIGIHGFDRGGLIVEAGKLTEEKIAPLIGSFRFPDEWRVALIRLPLNPVWHGVREQLAFEHLQANPTAELAQLLLTGILPSLVTKNLDAFGDFLHEYNIKAGEAFHAVQGGKYANPAIGVVIDELRRGGFRGVGQSSWGPTVFAIVNKGEQQYELVKRLCQFDSGIHFACESRGVQVTSTALSQGFPCQETNAEASTDQNRKP